MKQRLAMISTSFDLASQHLQSICPENVTHTHRHPLSSPTSVAVRTFIEVGCGIDMKRVDARCTAQRTLE
jgi:hypothetical protein